jgi:hypothetical protein
MHSKPPARRGRGGLVIIADFGAYLVGAIATLPLAWLYWRLFGEDG